MVWLMFARFAWIRPPPAGTIELQVVLQPSERLLGLLSALRARDWMRFFAEIKGHGCDSASGCAARPVERARKGA
jgi:hypothetical protein